MLANAKAYATLRGNPCCKVAGVLGAAALALAAAGCGSVSASSAISDATRDLRESEAQKAPEYAVYYYARAESYLAKAKECNGMGQFQVATEYARTSQGASEKALEMARIGRDQTSRREKFAPKNGEREKAPSVPAEEK
ncbi:MAG: DUF4398 domain-containing protein [Deltaproteobacteria bacterium]|nr:DUF4398 domain-containing protein [Deltaproteobacteria bacterium]